MEMRRWSEPPSSFSLRASHRAKAWRSSSVSSAAASRERVGAKGGPEGRVLLEPVKPYVLAVVVGVEDVRHRRRVDDLPPRYGLPQYSRAAGNTGRHLVGWVGPSTVSATAFQTA